MTQDETEESGAGVDAGCAANREAAYDEHIVLGADDYLVEWRGGGYDGPERREEE